MRKALVLLALLLLASSAHAYELSACKDNNSFGAMGNCIMRGSFGDPALFSIIFIAIFAIIMWQARVPIGATLGISVVLFFALGPIMPAGYYTLLMRLSLIVIGGLISLAILHFVRR